MENNVAKPKLLKRAIVYGFLLDILGSIVLGFIFGFIFAIKGGTKEEMLTSSMFLSVSAMIGMVMTVLGGFFAAYKAKFRPFDHAMWVGIILVLFSFVFSIIPLVIKLSTASGDFEVRDTISIVSLIVSLPLAYFGGYLASSILKKKENNSVSN